MAEHLAIIHSGMVTGVGFNSPASCAAIRCALDGFSETRFMDRAGEWIIGCEVRFEEPCRGMAKLVRMASMSIHECLSGVPELRSSDVALVLCVAEPERSGRMAGLEDALPAGVVRELGVRFHARSTVLARGRVGGAEAMAVASALISEHGAQYVLIAGVDSFLTAATIAEFEGRGRLLTNENSDGFIPGEAAAAVLVARSGGPMNPRGGQLVCLGAGAGREPATIDREEPVRGDGLVQAFRAAAADCGRPLTTLADTDYRISDASGPQYAFKEATLAVSRTVRLLKSRYDHWHPADCIGETGAAIGPCAMAVALTAAKKAYAPGPGVLCHFSLDSGDRAALVLRHQRPDDADRSTPTGNASEMRTGRSL